MQKSMTRAKADLKQALVETEQALDWMVKTRQQDGFQELKNRMKETENESSASLRERILDATIESIRERNKVEEENFGKAMLGLRLKMNIMGEQFKGIQQPSPEEQSALNEAENKVGVLKDKIEGMKNAWLFKKARTDLLKEELARAEEALAKLKSEIQERVNDRIRKAKIGNVRLPRCSASCPAASRMPQPIKTKFNF